MTTGSCIDVRGMRLVGYFHLPSYSDFAPGSGLDLRDSSKRGIVSATARPTVSQGILLKAIRTVFTCTMPCVVRDVPLMSTAQRFQRSDVRHLLVSIGSLSYDSLRELDTSQGAPVKRALSPRTVGVC